jgi:hypothetical protein
LGKSEKVAKPNTFLERTSDQLMQNKKKKKKRENDS